MADDLDLEEVVIEEDGEVVVEEVVDEEEEEMEDQFVEEEVVIGDEYEEEMNEDIESQEEEEEDNESQDLDSQEEECGQQTAEEAEEEEEEESRDERETEESEEVGHQEEEEESGLVGEDGIYQWTAFTGLRVKQFTVKELEDYRRPFALGWTREVVLRGTVNTSGKKIGDVYYFSPDKKTKLRSYVNMQDYLKRSQSPLSAENFTFARQPIHRPPQEIVRHAMQRGQSSASGHSSHSETRLSPSKGESRESSVTDERPRDQRSQRTSSNTSGDGGEGVGVGREETQERSGQMVPTVAEGRARRKRVAPSRFEDENYESESPFKKGREGGGRESGRREKMGNGQSQKSGPMTLQEKRRQLQHQLLQQVHERMTSSQPQSLLVQSEPTVTVGSSDVTSSGPIGVTEPTTVIQEEEEEEEREPIRAEVKMEMEIQEPEVKEVVKTKETARKSITASKEPEVKSSGGSQAESDRSDAETRGENGDGSVGQAGDQVAGAPCSMHCPGRRGMLPNLMCSRCFCLYHLDCVPGGVFLEEPRVFVCPNCLSPEDKKQEMLPNGDHVTDGDQLKTALLVSTPLLIQQPISKSRTTFAPILPKPPQLQQSALYQQMFHQMRPQRGHKTSVKNGLQQQNSTQLKTGSQYRVQTLTNGHSMVVKDQRARPRYSKKHSKTTDQSDQLRSLHNGGSQSSLLYRPAPIAPIGPLKLTPAQIERQLRDILVQGQLRGSGQKSLHSSRFSQWMERRSQSPVTSLLAPYQSLNQVLQHLTVRDLVKLRQVSRVFHQLSSQPHLWRHIRLKGIQLNDWLFLAKNIVESNQSATLDFDGVRPPAGEELVDFWRNFSSAIDYLKSVRSLRFGHIPSLVLEEVAAAAVQDNPYNNFDKLEELVAKNLFDEDNANQECQLNFLQDFFALSSLKNLYLSSNKGFKRSEEVNQLLTDVFSQMQLEQLTLINLKDFRSEDFLFLTQLKSLRRLAVGSCRHWFDSNHVAFKCLQELRQLSELRLQDIVLSEESQPLNETLESLEDLESLTLDNLRIESSVGPVLDQFSSVLRSSHSLKKLTISSSDPKTNQYLADHLLKRLDNCEKILWKVDTLVEDSGECFVPFPDSEEDKLMDLCLLNEVIQSELSHALVEIIPQ